MQHHSASKQSRRALQWVNFFLADVRDGLGPYLGIFLLTAEHWDAAQIGIALTVMGIASIIAQTPAGAFIDFTRYKRITIALVSIIIAITAILITWFPTFWFVISLKATMGIATAFIGPAIAGMTLGLVGPDYFAQQVGKNEAYNHAGNIVAAILAGIVGFYFSTAAVFYLVGIMAFFALISLSGIKKEEIDHDLARGFLEEQTHTEKASGFSTLFKSKVLLLFTLCICLFHFANAAMLPLLGQWLATTNPKFSSTYMSAAIIVAQVVMIPMAIMVGKKANAWGRKKIFLAAFLVLPIRGILYTLWHNPYYLISIQVLDGIGAGIFGALFLIVIADLTEGTGRFNITQGAVTTIMGIGAALSTTVAGEIVVASNYDTAFETLAGIALTAFLIFLFFMPETKDWATRQGKIEP